MRAAVASLALQQAQLLGLVGWVRNRGDGTVEAVIAGEEDTVRELLRACRRGPARARGEDIVETVEEALEAEGFTMGPSV